MAATVPAGTKKASRDPEKRPRLQVVGNRTIDDELTRLRDLIVEACNANDPDLLLQLTEWPIDPATLDAIFQHTDFHPRAVLTAGVVEGSPVAVAWADDGSDGYRVVGVIENTVEGGEVIHTFRSGRVPGLVADLPPG